MGGGLQTSERAVLYSRRSILTWRNANFGIVLKRMHVCVGADLGSIESVYSCFS